MGTPKTIREQLEESFKKAEEAEQEEEQEEQEEQEVEETEESSDKPDESGGDKDDEGGEGGDKADESASTKSEESGADGVSKKEEEEDDIRAPVSWKPAIREHWKGLPKEVKQEINRRETEIQRGLHQASGYKRVAEEYAGVIRPFEHLIRAQNSTPAQAVTNLMQTAARLTLGTPAQKAQVVCEIIKNYGVDIQTLDSVLAGEKLPDDQYAPLLQKIEERLKPVTDFMGQVTSSQTQQQQELAAKAETETQAFAQDPKNEFYEDVREDMADILELAAKRGRTMTLKEAYDRACRENPEVSKIIQQREEAQKVDLDKKRRAASSLRGSAPAQRESSGGDGSIRDSIMSAWDEHETAR